MTGWGAFWNAYRRVGTQQLTTSTRRVQKQSQNLSQQTTPSSVRAMTTMGVGVETAPEKDSKERKYPEWINEYDDLMVDVSRPGWWES